MLLPITSEYVQKEHPDLWNSVYKPYAESWQWSYDITFRGNTNFLNLLHIFDSASLQVSTSELLNNTTTVKTDPKEK